MTVDIVCHFHCEAARRFSPPYVSHLLGKLLYHVVLQVDDRALPIQELRALNIGVGEGESVLRPEPAADRRAGDQRGGHDKGILQLTKLISGHLTGSGRRCGGCPGAQRLRISAADYVCQRFLQLQGVVKGVFGFGVIDLLRSLLLDTLLDDLLLLAADRHIPQLQPFAAEHVIDGAKHGQQVFQRHPENALDSLYKSLRLLCRHIRQESQLPDGLILRKDLCRGTDHKADLSDLDNAVDVKTRGGIVTDPIPDGEDLVPIKQHRILRQRNDRVIAQ